MKRPLLPLFVIAVASMAPASSAQTPTVTVYFDSELTQTWTTCPDAPSGTVLDTLYVVATDFNAWMDAIEYRINYPESMQLVADLVDTNALMLGSSAFEIWITFTETPRNAFQPLLLQRAIFFWRCAGCEGNSSTVTVEPAPRSGLLRAVVKPNQTIIEGIGATSYICSRPPRPASWGRIKSLYE